MQIYTLFQQIRSACIRKLTEQGPKGRIRDVCDTFPNSLSSYLSIFNFCSLVLCLVSGGLAVQVGWLGLRVGGHLGAESAFIK